MVLDKNMLDNVNNSTLDKKLKGILRVYIQE